MFRWLWFSLLLATHAFAQTNAGQITGTVTDPHQAAVAGARITAINLATNVQQTTVSSEAGLYSLPALEPGTYRLSADLAGFNRLNREPITVETSHRVLVRKPLSAISKLRMSDSIRLAAKDVSSGEQATGRRRSVSVAPSGKRAPADRSMNNLWWEAWRVEPKSVRPAQWL